MLMHDPEIVPAPSSPPDPPPLLHLPPSPPPPFTHHAGMIILMYDPEIEPTTEGGPNSITKSLCATTVTWELLKEANRCKRSHMAVVEGDQQMHTCPVVGGSDAMA